MKIRNKIMLLISLLLLVAAIYFLIERLMFLSTAVHTQGSVAEVKANNTRCGGGRRRSPYNCTKFSVRVDFSAYEKIYNLRLSGGSTRGWDQPLSNAKYRVGQNVPVVYSPKNPNDAYEDTFWGVWAVPVMMFIGQIITFFSSFAERRRSFR